MWDYPVLTDDDWDQLKNLAGFVSDLDLANLLLKVPGMPESHPDVAFKVNLI